ncbi:hypothetical protein LTS08_007746 [Lithohypha guttulata]|nr:hypothetical protein LTS08_007746 [Lithohypha guttulata]
MTTAVVTGATGLTGSAIVDALLKDNHYKQIYTLSRSQPSTAQNSKVTHAHLDLQSSASDMSKDLSSVQGDEIIVFFCAYLANPDEAEAAKINGGMLKNFLEALELTGAIKSVKRIVLTCGLKQYGVHLGMPKQPMHEDDFNVSPGLRPGDKFSWPENFYYTQQDILTSHAVKNGYSYVTTFPQDVLGFARHNFMNECTALGLYASVGKLAHPNSELPFPGSKECYLAFNTWTSAKLHAKFCLWAARAPNAADQMFNVVNGDTESWMNLWPRVCARFGCKVPNSMFPGGSNGERPWWGFSASSRTELHSPPPVAVQATSDVPGIGFGMPELAEKPSSLYSQIDTEKWAKDERVIKAWETLRDKYGLEQKAWEKATWGFLTFVLGRDYSNVVSMSKARKMGWNGYEDTWDAFEDAFRELEAEGILPPLNKLKEEKSLA